MKIILASNSPRRKEILEKNNIIFEVHPSNIKEVLDPNLDGKENAKKLAKDKCIDVYNCFPNDIIIAADTIVYLEGVIYGKPKDEKDAFNMLETLQGKTHYVITGLAIKSCNRFDNVAVISEVTFKKMSDREILDYIKTKEPFGKAGSYAIQGIGNKYIKCYKGEFENVMGLPIKEVKELLIKHKKIQ